MLCRTVGMARQNYYKSRRVRERLAVDEALVLELIRKERSYMPRLGCRKLRYLVQAELEAAGVRIGRDRFFALLRRHNMLIERPKRGARTTDSRHGFAVYPNIAKDMQVTGPHQLWVSDITYIRTDEGFMYLSLVMDAFSRKIVGFDSSDNLEMEGVIRAGAQAIKQLPAGAYAVHHSDRGSQYCSQPYIKQLKAAELGISMTEENHCYENGKAERLNGILKQELGIGTSFSRKALVAPAVAEAVAIYNQCRPHGKLKMRVPQQVHRDGIIPQTEGPTPGGDAACQNVRQAGGRPRRVGASAALRSDSLRSPCLRCADAPTRSPEGS
jgi:transposase InsO family protein